MKSKIIFTAIALGFTSLAFGQGMGMGMGITQSFADLDADESGAVSKEELGKAIPAEQVDRMFSRLDADENGEISEEEFENRQAGGMGMGMGG